jgi:RNA polymerase sigma-70 factor (ECF subfamily)
MSRRVPTLVQLFEAARGDAVPASAEVEAGLQRILDEARAAWPTLEVATEDFFRRVAEGQPADRTVEEWLEVVRAADLYLACACERAAPGALEVFDEHFLAPVLQVLRRKGYPAELVDEVSQDVREKLFLASPSRPPRILDYSGQGGLVQWLRVVAARVAIDVRRRMPQLAQLDTSREQDSHDPELDFIKAQYRHVFKEAFQSAVATLSSEHRNLLRLHFVEGATLHELASLFQVHRVTISRQIASAREEILEGTRRRLSESLSSAELTNVLQLLRSQLDLSISRVLEARPDPA